MDNKQITEALQDIFDKENHRIVFWYDRDGEFAETLPGLDVDDVNVLRLDEQSPLEVKIRLEIEDPESRYLLYAPYHEPTPENDWLLDIRLYSRTFHADKASIIANELGLENQAVRSFIRAHPAFFKSADRWDRLKKWATPRDREDDLAVKMMAVLARAEQPDLFAVLIKLYEACCHQDRYDESKVPKAWDDIRKMGLEERFWKFAADTFGYDNRENPGLPDLILRLTVTEMTGALNGEAPASVAHFVLPENAGALNAAVFLSQWRSHIKHHHQYHIISGAIGKKIDAPNLLSGYDPQALQDVMTFEAVEKRIISALRDAVIEKGGQSFKQIRAVINRRLDGYWAGAAPGDGLQTNRYQAAYHALEKATRLFDLRKTYDEGMSYAKAEAMFSAYTKELFYFDQFYRGFNENADAVEKAGWDVLKPLRESVENCYTGWYLENLGLAWGDFLEADDGPGLLDDWCLPGICNQEEFFREFVEPVLKSNPRNRIFVIASDALRYEAAEEFTREINSRYRLKADLSAMLGVVPGYTALGMASLLPHNTLSFTEKADVLADGSPVASMEQREKTLASREGTAVKADSLMAMTKDQGREFVKPYRVIYIYHDRIDATGDKAVSEGETFHAVRRAIEALYAMVRFIINSLNGTRVIITADHGFVYHEKPPAPMDKTDMTAPKESILKQHKRFMLGNNLNRAQNAFYGSTKNTAGTENDLFFITPKGTRRFSFTGGARFFHGGTMPQEIAVPVVTVTEAKGGRLAETEVRRAGVSLLGTHKKIVTNIPRFKFIQTDAVSERVHPRALKISIRDGNTLISNEETVTFDSQSTSVEERTRSIKLHLTSGPFDSTRLYDLVLRHADDDTEYERLSLYIDLAFANDF